MTDIAAARAVMRRNRFYAACREFSYTMRMKYHTGAATNRYPFYLPSRFSDHGYSPAAPDFVSKRRCCVNVYGTRYGRYVTWRDIAAAVTARGGSTIPKLCFRRSMNGVSGMITEERGRSSASSVSFTPEYARVRLFSFPNSTFYIESE